jgi:hypothetical protein
MQLQLHEIAPGHEPGHIFSDSICFCKRCHAVLAYPKSVIRNFCDHPKISSTITYPQVSCAIHGNNDNHQDKE